MRQKTKKIAIGCSGVLLLGILILYAGSWLIFDIESPLNRKSAFFAVYEWARLMPIPESAKNVSISTRGSMFTREFDLEFDAPKADIESWLLRSPGTKSITPKKTVQGESYYEISPGGGAVGADLTVSPDGIHVKIHTVWS